MKSSAYTPSIDTPSPLQGLPPFLQENLKCLPMIFKNTNPYLRDTKKASVTLSSKIFLKKQRNNFGHFFGICPQQNTG